ncbi:XTP/dITP diphosphatase [Chloroflexota bacterium]
MISKELLVATNNKGKLKEYNVLLKGIPFTLVSLAQQGIDFDVAETGSTFEQNAALKASEYASASGLMTLADDSGLEVDALGGKPGVMSARYAGEGATDADRVNYLLAKIIDVPWEKRTARFKCVIAIAIKGEDVKICYGTCSGYITHQPKGTNGFGYDPIFYFPELDRTMAELTFEQKNSVSHRGKAASQAHKLLMSLQ